MFPALLADSLLSKPPGKYMLPQFTLFRTVFLIFWEKKKLKHLKVKVTQLCSTFFFFLQLLNLIFNCTVTSVELFVSPWTIQSMEFFGQHTGVGSLSFLQGAFLIQGSNPGLPHCRQILYQLSHKGSQRILEWVAYPFSSGSSQHRNQTGVSCIAGRFFTNWAMREALKYWNAWTKLINKCWETKKTNKQTKRKQIYKLINQLCFWYTLNLFLVKTLTS